MPEFIYPTSTKVRGPLLISASSLRDLDEILAEQMPLLREARAAQLDTYVTQRMASASKRDPSEDELQSLRKGYERTFSELSQGRDISSLILYFSNGSKLRVQTFDEASTHADATLSTPIGFDLTLQCGVVSLKLLAESDSLETTMNLYVTPNTCPEARNLYSAVKRWMRTVQPPRWQQWWLVAGHFRPVIWGAMLTLALTVWGISAGDSDSRYFKEQGQQILKQGVSSANQQKAIETLLAIQSGAAAPIDHKVGNWLWFFFLGSGAVSLILSYPPKLVLGLGVGEDKIGYWRTWTRFVFVLIPGFIASNFLWPYLSEMFKKLVAK